MSFLALLKVRSHSVAIAGIDGVSKAHKTEGETCCGAHVSK